MIIINYLTSLKWFEEENGTSISSLPLYLFFFYFLASLSLALFKNLLLAYFSCNALIFK
jgi:hypothetical protein